MCLGASKYVLLSGGVEMEVAVVVFWLGTLWKLASLVMKNIFLGRNFLRCHDDTLASFLAKVPLSQW